MNQLTLDDIKKYVEEKGPKKVKNPDYRFTFGLFELFDKILGIFGVKGLNLEPYEVSENARIKELLPPEGEIALSSRKTTVIMYDEQKHGFYKANFDMETGQPVPNSSQPYELKDIVPASSLEVISFSGCALDGGFAHETFPHKEDRRKHQAANFLEEIIELSQGVEVLEVGKNTGDSYNRFFPIRKYNSQ